IYLGEKGYVHCDLTARNIYVGKCDIVKIGGFGLAEQLQDDRSTIDEESELSIGWTAPEIVITNEYTIKSDVWSFGFLLYEIIFYISNLYLQYSVKEILQKVLDGYQLTKPNDCHEQYYEIMCSCWQNNSDNRPPFQTLFTRFDEFIKQLDLNDENGIYNEV
ncbi:unnamed protein product, partial [Adineta steineri]